MRIINFGFIFVAVFILNKIGNVFIVLFSRTQQKLIKNEKNVLGTMINRHSFIIRLKIKNKNKEQCTKTVKEFFY